MHIENNGNSFMYDITAKTDSGLSRQVLLYPLLDNHNLTL